MLSGRLRTHLTLLPAFENLSRETIQRKKREDLVYVLKDHRTSKLQVEQL